MNEQDNKEENKDILISCDNDNDDLVYLEIKKEDWECDMNDIPSWYEHG